MQSPKMVFLLICLFPFQICFGQEKPKAELVDEFGKLNCDDFLARTHNFAVSLANNPNSQGDVIVYGEKNEQYYNHRFMDLIKAGIVQLRLDISRFVFVRGDDSNDLRIQFWIVPTGADRPDFVEENWSYKIEFKKPFIFENTQQEDGICPPMSDFDLYSKLLIANSNLRSNLVIYEKSQIKFRQTEKELINKLVKDYKVPKKRFKAFFVRSDYAGVEFWLVPNKKK